MCIPSVPLERKARREARLATILSKDTVATSTVILSNWYTSTQILPVYGHFDEWTSDPRGRPPSEKRMWQICQ